MADRSVPTGWKASLPKRAKVQLANKVGVYCVGCESILDLGTTNEGLTVCVGCFGAGGYGFGWWRN